jgi:hypothetical protein
MERGQKEGWAGMHLGEEESELCVRTCKAGINVWAGTC